MFFEPEPSVLKVAQDIVHRAHVDADVLVGVHIRLTDYRTYRNGIFHYRVQDYRRTLEQ